MNLRNVGEYNIGLDIGTGSVGWAVIDSDGEICHFKENQHGVAACSHLHFLRQKLECTVGNDVATPVVNGVYLFCKSCLQARSKQTILNSSFA